MNWKVVKDIPQTWIKLELDSAGYIVYKPCDGNTPMITIHKGHITVYWALDGPSRYSINKYTASTNKKTFSIDCKNEAGSDVFNIDIKDEKKKIVLWTFACNKWVMTPFKFKDEFRQVDNPCHGEMKPEKPFLPVEF